jgi:tRNA 5-methylaminomethyl-2-thiouridine biosynthesis bifunctional protein
MTATSVIRPARLAWRDEQPFSKDFDDIYHAADGAEEVRRVFTDPSGLPERFRDRRFVIAELGFGTGLNFAVAAQQFLDNGGAGRLHFVSFEQFPLDTADFQRVAASRRNELPLYTWLEQVQPPRLPGWHRRHSDKHRITLSLYYGDAAQGLDDLLGRCQPFDAWFLDGFAPDRNRDMWGEKLLQSIGQLSSPGATVATFTAVGDVRRGLAAAGFSVERLDQQPHKLHSLRGVYQGKPAAPSRSRSATVIGGGLAGAAVAHHLARLDVAVSVLDSGGVPANDLPATVLHPRLRADDSQAAQLRVAAYHYATHVLALDPARPGVLQLPGPNWDEQRRARAIDFWLPTGNWLRPLSPTQASELLGQPCSLPGVHFPAGANLDLASINTGLTDHSNITVQRNAEVTSIDRHGEDWRVVTNTTSTLASDLVLCAGPATNALDVACYLELLPMWGQLELLNLTNAPPLPVLSDGYLAPAGEVHALGATYERAPWSAERASRQNLERFAGWWQLTTGKPPEFRRLGSVRGVRSVTSDRLPIVGTLHNASHHPLPNLHVSTGHGSSGTSFALLAAECVASEIAGEFAPLTKDALAAVSGLRFLERQARRGLKHGARELSD